ncbi:MAG: thioredoxin family protein [Lentisphaerae bacterium]|nr:thioredoxin family protein [Lentisphaerota bacterium]
MQKIEIISAAAFAGAVRHGTVLVLFTADWCGHCVTQSRIIDSMASQNRFPEAVRIGVVDVGEAPLIAEKLEIEAIPAVIVFRDGVELHRHIGIIGEDELLTLLQ